MQVHIHIYLSNEITSFRSDNIFSKAISYLTKNPVPSIKNIPSCWSDESKQDPPPKYTTAVALGCLPNFKVSTAKDIKALWKHNLGGSKLDLNPKCPP